ncbi:hypothetical protein DFP72DRAFT_443836 [Ephemerocybe angulata]|uniref:Uncharacterized protein n=1 Tax=Ephemerocybe angulata TaxID=980116 RepID=A0A8H6M696_9AGAR|nr:hypothetical protein DFP72DRAFT_443836 [Tulosesus angulatus]
MDEPSPTPGWSFLAHEGTSSEVEEQLDEITTSSPAQALPGSSRAFGSNVKRHRETESSGRPQKRQKQGSGTLRQNERASTSNDHGPRPWQGQSRRGDGRLEDTEMHSDGPSSSRPLPTRPQGQPSSSREPSNSRRESLSGTTNQGQRQAPPDREVITFPDSPPQIARKTTGRGPRASAVKAQQVPDEVIEISSDSDEEDTRTARKRAASCPIGFKRQSATEARNQ